MVNSPSLLNIFFVLSLSFSLGSGHFLINDVLFNFRIDAGIEHFFQVESLIAKEPEKMTTTAEGGWCQSVWI